jgi:hypothetical protein
MLNLEALSTFMMVAASLGAVAAAVGMLIRFRWSRAVVAAMIFVGAAGVATTAGGLTLRLWLYPLQSNRSAAFLLLGTLLFVPMVGHYRLMPKRGLPRQGAVLLIIVLYAGLLRIVHEGPLEGLQSIAFALGTALPLLFVLPALLREPDHFTAMVRMVAVANVAWVAAVAVQVVIDPSVLGVGRILRFHGLTGNPQHAANFLAVMAVIALWLLLNDPKRKSRLLWLGLLGADLLLLAWTGSRTGAGMFVVGAMAAVYRRLGRTVLLLPLVVVVLFAGLHLVSLMNLDVAGATERIGSTEDTRTAAWLAQWTNAMEHPFIGVGVYETESENSYLYAFSAYGLGMVILVLLLMAVSGGLMWQLLQLRRWARPGEQVLVDLVLAYNMMYFAGAMFDGWIMARVGTQLVLMLAFSAMASQLLRQLREATDLADWEGDEAIGCDDDAYNYQVADSRSPASQEDDAGGTW